MLRGDHTDAPDRLAADLPARGEFDVVVVDAPLAYDSPHTRREYTLIERRGRAELRGGGNRQRMYRQLRGDPLARLHAHRQIDDAQYQAGRRYQADCERAEISVAAVDPTREPVDGGGARDPFSDGRLRALRAIAEADAVLGARAARLMRWFLAERMTIRAIAAACGVTRRAQIDHIGWEISRALEVLALHYGFAARGR